MMAYSKPAGSSGGVPMDSTVTPTPPKFPQDFTVAHFLDRIVQVPLFGRPEILVRCERGAQEGGSGYCVRYDRGPLEYHLLAA